MASSPMGTSNHTMPGSFGEGTAATCWADVTGFSPPLAIPPLVPAGMGDELVVVVVLMNGPVPPEMDPPPEEMSVPEPVPVSPPDGPDTVEAPVRGTVAVEQDYDAFHNAGVEHRWVTGSFVEEGPATDWIRLAVPVFDDAPPTPLQRVFAAADFANGVSRMARFEELLFINPDLTVHLHRMPVGEWVCLDAVSVLEPHGVGLAQAALWDEQGLIGRSLQSLLLDSRG
jgi:hypothetical protein